MPIIIKLLKKLTIFLENIEKSNSLTETREGSQQVTKKFSKLAKARNILIFIFSLIVLLSGFFISWNYFKFRITNLNTNYTLLFVIVLVQIIQIINFLGLYKKIRTEDPFVVRYMYFIYFPLLFSLHLPLVEIVENYRLSINISKNLFSIINIYAHCILIGIYPLLFIITELLFNIKGKIIDKIKRIFLVYNLGYFLFLTVFTIFAMIGFKIKIAPWSEVLSILSSRHGSFEFISGLLFVLFTFFVLTYSIFSLNTYFGVLQKSRKKLHYGIFAVISVYVITLLINFAPYYLNNFYIFQIDKASKIISTKGDNYASYNEARGIWFLESAFLSSFKHNNGQYDLFKKLYDSTPEEYFGEELADYKDFRRSFATNLSKIGEKAEVILSLAEIESTISTGSLYPILETVYTFNFTNIAENNENQEVIVHFETPSKDSVIHSLKLGLNLELTGQISPRGAARQVYENSLKKNIDPALLEKIGLNTYSLRVFPIPAKNDTKTRGKQKVQLRMITPLFNAQNNIIYSPKFSFINLNFSPESALISKIYNSSQLEKEDIVNKGEVEKYLKEEHVMNINGVDVDKKYCIDKKLFIDPDLTSELDNILSYSGSNNTGYSKTSIYFDNSASAQKNGIFKYYNQIYDNVKNNGNKLNDVDIYTYNFGVDKIAKVEDIKFFGYSDIAKIIEYISNNKIRNERIILVTDDSSFDYNSKENKDNNYEIISSNQISIIKIGKKTKSYKNEITNLLSASNGNVYELSSNTQLTSLISKIINTQADTGLQICDSGALIDNNIAKIQGGYLSRILLSRIKNEQDWLRIADLQNKIANNFGIINEFNSLIALQLYSQQEELDEYSKGKDKYDTEHKNYEGGNDNINTFTDNTVEMSTPSVSLNSDPVSNYKIAKDGISLRMTNKASVESIQSNSFSYDSYDELKGYSSNYGERSLIGFDGDINISLLGFFILIIYLVEIVSVYHFIFNYIKGQNK